MTLLKHALKNIKREWAVHLITMLQLAAVIVITLAMTSSIMLRYRYYAAFKDVLNENSLLFYSQGAPAMQQPEGDEKFSRLLPDEELRRIFPEAENIITCNVGDYYIIDENGNFLTDTMVNDSRPEGADRYDVTTLLYDDELIKRCKPELSKGRWLKTSDSAGFIEGVISENYLGINVGDTVRMSAVLDPYAEQPFRGVENVYMDEYGAYCGEIEVKIVGKIRSKSKVAGYMLNTNGASGSVAEFYGTANLEQLDNSVLILSSNYISKTTDTVQGARFPTIVTFPEGTPKSVFNKAKLDAAAIGFRADAATLDAYADNTQVYIYEHLRQLLPIIIVLTVMLLISSVSSSALSARRGMRNYAVYYITGLEWKHCSLISLIQAAIVAAASLVPAGIAAAVISLTEISETYRIIFTGESALILLGILAFYILVSMLMPTLMLSGTTPKQILTR